MKVCKFLGILVLIALSSNSFGQVGIGTTSPSDKSALDVSSQINGLGNHLGLLLPRVPTAIARDQIPATESDKGMMVFVLSTGCLDIYNGNFWESINCTESTPPLTVSTDVWINEFHYNNVGTDSNEFIEVAGRGGIDLSSYSMVLYNGANGLSYNTTNFTSILADDTTTGFGFESLSYPVNGIQNGIGTPDGIALIDPSGIVLQFLSYGGTFEALNGPAAGMTSEDIGIQQTGNATQDPIGASLQLTGIGSEYVNFTWIRTTVNTINAENTGQTIN